MVLTDLYTASDCAGVSAAQAPATIAIDWSFMDATFYQLLGLVTVDDPTRFDAHDGSLGRCDPSEWWLNVSIEDSAARREDLETRLYQIREAIVLQSIMAHVAYDAWVVRLIKTTGFKLAPFMHLIKDGVATQQRLPCQFVVVVPPSIRPEEHFAFENLFRLRNWSASFQSQLKKMYAVLSAKQIDVASLPSSRIKLKLEPGDVGKDRQKTIIKCIMEMLMGMLCYEKHRESHCDFDKSLPNVPAIHLERVDINLINFILMSPMLKDLERLLEVDNVPIGTLTLPGRFGCDAKEVMKVRPAWAAFVCMLCGVEGPANKKILTTQIQELDLPSAYCREDLCVPLMMALRDAMRLKAVRVSLWSMKSSDDISQDSRFGAILAYAVLHKNYSSSIE